MTGVKYSDNKTVTIPSSSLPIDYIQDTTDQLSAFDNDVECIYSEEIEFIINSLETESENDRTSASSYPGTRAGEKCPQSDLACYTLLFRNYPHWRHMLSNDYGSHLDLDGHTFASVEHYICANKFKHAPDIYNRFCLDLGDTIVGGASPAQIKKWGHSLPITQEELDDWDRRKKKAMKRALLAKFAQNEELQQVLLLTKNATLLSPCSTKLESLMWVRTILHQSDNYKISSKGKNKNTNDTPKDISMINKTHPLEIEKQAATNINLNDKFTKEATDAVSYLSLVKKETQSQPEVYNQFLQLLNDFSLNRINTPQVLESIATLFKGKPWLIRSFLVFLPPGHVIDDANQADYIYIRTSKNGSIRLSL